MLDFKDLIYNIFIVGFIIYSFICVGIGLLIGYFIF